MNHSTICVLLATIFYLIIPSYGLDGNNGTLQKCHLDDSNCISQSFTYIIQHSKERPNLRIPNLNPYKSTYQCSFKQFEVATMFANFHWSQITVRGIDTMIFHKISGFQLGQTISAVQINMSITKLILEAISNSQMKILLTPIKINERITMIMENVVIQGSFKVHIDQHNATNCLSLSDTSVARTDLSSFKMNVAHTYLSTAMADMVDGAVNSNWKLIKPFVDPILNKFIGDCINTVLTPMFQEICHEGMLNKNSTSGGGGN